MLKDFDPSDNDNISDIILAERELIRAAGNVAVLLVEDIATEAMLGGSIRNGAERIGQLIRVIRESRDFCREK